MMPLSVSFVTLGCKLNQLETESAADSLRKAGMGLRAFGEPADLCVVNTCTVTGKAEQKARRAIRKTLSENPDGVVLATGCYAQMDPAALASLHPRIVVLPGEEKSALLKLGAWLQDNWQGHGDVFDALLEWKRSLAPGSDKFDYEPDVFAFHSRPSIKIEDGCDNRCSYCRVCLARGPAISLAKEIVLSRTRALESKGKAEVVLTGVNLSHYRDGDLRFPGLLEYLIASTERIAFRISSYEPDGIDQGFLDAFASPRVRPHIHLSVQSGSTAVLRTMARPYDAERVREAAEALRRAKEDPFLAADIIAGFPGESERDFEETLSLCRDLDFAWIHAFPFSARPGTRAFDMRPKIPERLTGERVGALEDLAKRGKRAYVERWVGREVQVVVESDSRLELGEDDSPQNLVDGKSPNLKARVHGTSENYLKLWLLNLSSSPGAGASVRAKIAAFEPESQFDGSANLV